MMQTNGAAQHHVPESREVSAAKMPTPEQQVDATIALTVGVFVNGMLQSLGGFFRFDHLAIGMCRVFAGAIGVGMRGNLAQVLKLRAQCKEAFDKGLTGAPISPAAPPAEPPRG